MGPSIRIINSPKLLGIEKDHSDHSRSATMRSTGNVHLVRADETELDNWYVEYKCESCKQILRQWDADVVDIVREALKDAGVIAD